MTGLSLLLAALVFAPGTAPLGHAMAPPPAAPTALAAPSWPVTVGAARGDAWTGEDKAQHLFMSFALTAMTYGVARAAGMEARVALPVAGGLGLAAGIGKEIHDRRRGGFFSTRDLAFDLLGIGLGLTLASYTR